MKPKTPGEKIMSYLSENRSAHIQVLAIRCNTTEEIVESIVRDYASEGKVRYLHDEQEGGARVVILTDGFS